VGGGTGAQFLPTARRVQHDVPTPSSPTPNIHRAWIAVIVAVRRVSSSSFLFLTPAAAPRIRQFDALFRALIRSSVALVLARTLLQDLYYPPSRILLPPLPSRLSRYSTVTL
jgi:hypothetical protein